MDVADSDTAATVPSVSPCVKEESPEAADSDSKKDDERFHHYFEVQVYDENGFRVLLVRKDKREPKNGGESEEQDENECPKRSRKYKSKNFLIKREFKDHEQKPFTCPNCSYTCFFKSSLNHHILTHTPYSSTVQCPKRPRKYKSKNYLIKREVTDHEQKLFTCPDCSYTCFLKSSLNHHILTHTPYCCDYCGYSSTDKDTLKRHIFTHTGDKPFACPECPYTCRRKQKLNVHMLKHTGNKQFSCIKCGYACYTRSQLKSHVHIHSKDKPFKCPECSFKTSTKLSLSRHMYKHGGVKPYGCSRCTYTSITKQDMDRHMLTHTGVKLFSCDVCSYKSIEKKKITRHMISHSKKKPFACSACCTAYSTKSSLNRHNLSHHKNKTKGLKNKKKYTEKELKIEGCEGKK